MRRTAVSSLIACILLPFALSRSVAQESQPSANALKSAFLFNFLKFVEWPARALPEKTSPMIIALLPDSSIRKDLEDVVQNRKIEEHPIQIKELKSATATPDDCHLLFIDAAHDTSATQILSKLKGRNVLTVGESDGFLQSGGMINFVQTGTKIRFQIQKDTAVAAGLQISAKLLSIALPTK
jgi:hypothetical protein